MTYDASSTRPHWHSAEPGGFAVAADGVRVAAERRARHDDVADGIEHEHQHDAVGNADHHAARYRLIRAELVDRFATRDHEGQTTGNDIVASVTMKGGCRASRSTVDRNGDSAGPRWCQAARSGRPACRRAPASVTRTARYDDSREPTRLPTDRSMPPRLTIVPMAMIAMNTICSRCSAGC
jgi:hypothetical protein